MPDVRASALALWLGLVLGSGRVAAAPDEPPDAPAAPVDNPAAEAPAPDDTAPPPAPPPEPAPKAAPPPAVQPDEVAPPTSLDPAGADGLPELDQTTRSKLQLYGFSSMTARRIWFGEGGSVYRGYQKPEAAFAMGQLNVYIRSDMTSRLSSLLEVRLLYLPHGATTTDPTTGKIDTASTVVLEDSEIGGTVQWGGIAIQRAHLDYQLTDRVMIRAGHWLTPYGIWNVDHGSPTVLGVRRPVVINEALFPESQIGLQVQGTTSIASADLTWTGTISNGRISSITDHDLDKAVGGRLELALPALDELRVGASGYFALEHAYDFQASATDPSDLSTATLIRKDAGKSRELALGGDLRIRAGRLRVLAEAIVAQRTFQGSRPLAALPRFGGFEPDHRNVGGYVIAGWQTTTLSAMPFLQFENRRGTTLNATMDVVSMGVNIRPLPTLVLKLDMGAGRIAPVGRALTPPTTLRTIEAQVAWVFR